MQNERIDELIIGLAGNEFESQRALQEIVKIGYPAVPALIEALKSKNPEVMERAGEALLKLSPPQDAQAKEKEKEDSNISSLIRRLDDYRGAKSAIKELAEIGEPAIPSLVSALWRNDTLTTPINAGKVLGRILKDYPKNREIQKTLLKLFTELGNEDSHKMGKAARCIGDIGDLRGLMPLVENIGTGDWWSNHQIAESIGKIAKENPESKWVQDAASILVGNLEKGGNTSRNSAAALGKIGDLSAAPALLDALGKGETMAADALYWIIHENKENNDCKLIISAMVELLGPEDKSVTMAVSKVLGEAGDPDAVPALTYLFGHENEWIVNSAIEAVRMIAGVKENAGNEKLRDAVPSLMGVAQSETKHVREKAVEALERIADERALPTLVAGLGDRWEDIRKPAAKGLEAIGLEKVDLETRVLALSISRNYDEILKIGAAALPGLVSNLESEHQEIRQFSGWMILEKLGFEKVDLRANVLARMAHGGIGKVSAMEEPIDEILEGLLEHEHISLAFAAAKILAKKGNPAAVPQLAFMLDQRPFVREDARDALLEIGQAAGPAMLGLLDKEPSLCSAECYAMDVVGQLGTPEAAPLLLKFLTNENSVIKRRAAWAIGEIAEKNPGNQDVLKAVPFLLDEKFCEIGPCTRRDAIDSLREGASEALWKISSHSVLSVLVERLDDKNPELQEKAAGILGKMGLTTREAKAMLEMVPLSQRDTHEGPRANFVKPQNGAQEKEPGKVAKKRKA